MTRVLVVDDEPQILRALRINLHARQYDVVTAGSGQGALLAATEAHPDLVILDLGLPDMDGVDVIRSLREWTQVPIVILSGRMNSAAKVDALDAGADDYVTKPFSFLELMARVEAVLRRSSGYAETVEQYRFGDVEIDFKRSEARKAGQPIILSPREFKLMSFLIEHRGEVLTRERLLDAVWGYENVPFTRTVDMHIAKLRKKIEDRPHDPGHIVTVHRMGYKFTA